VGLFVHLAGLRVDPGDCGVELERARAFAHDMPFVASPEPHALAYDMPLRGF
jgi:hypothetical protein